MTVQAERRERELQRRAERKTAPPIAGLFSTTLVGVTYVPGYPDNLGRLWYARQVFGPQMLNLEREPDNEHDPNAIAVYWHDELLGHLNRVIAFRLAPELDAGVTWLARVESVAGDDDLIGCTIRLKRQDT